MKSDPIADLRRFLAEAAELGKRGRAAFDSDHMLELAALAIITRVGVAANRVPDERRADYPDVPWRSMVGMRNRLVHDYDMIDYDLVWEVIARHIPKIAANLQR